MSFEEILLIMTAGILTVLALGVSYFLGGEIIRVARDALSTSLRAYDGDADDDNRPIRQITPFRDRETVQKIIDHFEDEEVEESGSSA